MASSVRQGHNQEGGDDLNPGVSYLHNYRSREASVSSVGADGWGNSGTVSLVQSSVDYRSVLQGDLKKDEHRNAHTILLCF